MFTDSEQSSIEYKEMAKSALETPDSAILLKQIAAKSSQIQDEIKSATNEIDSFNEQSIYAIEEHERGWLIVQIGIIITVGVITTTLRHFFGQINSELKKEIESKTHELSEANKKLHSSCMNLFWRSPFEIWYGGKEFKITLLGGRSQH